jgi:hypothetical protein
MSRSAKAGKPIWTTQKKLNILLPDFRIQVLIQIRLQKIQDIQYKKQTKSEKTNLIRALMEVLRLYVQLD